MDLSAAPELTVCVCTHDRVGYLRDCLDGLRFQTAPAASFEVVVVDSCSPPETRGELDAAAALANARLVRLVRPGVSVARNAGARAAAAPWVAFIDDDAIPAPDWVEAIRAVISRPDPPALFGGRILPLWEAPLPAWWPSRLRGVLSLIECRRAGEYRTAQVPKTLEPYGANMVVNRGALFAVGGFDEGSGRFGRALLSDEEVQLAWRLQAAGRSARHEPTVMVRHQIQARRLTPGWLLKRLFWQGASSVMTRRLLGRPGSVWRALPRRVAVAALFAPAALMPSSSARLIAARWRFAYSAGFVCAAMGWGASSAARQAAK